MFEKKPRIGAQVINYLKEQHPHLFAPENMPWTKDAAQHIKKLVGSQFSAAEVDDAVRAIMSRNKRYIAAGLKNDYCYHIASGTNYTPISTAQRDEFKRRLLYCVRNPEKLAYFQEQFGRDLDHILAETQQACYIHNTTQRAARKAASQNA